MVHGTQQDLLFEDIGIDSKGLNIIVIDVSSENFSWLPLDGARR
jgi:hypothetical protein